MYITDINHTKRGRFSVYVDGSFYGVLHPDVYSASWIRVGDEADIAVLDELIAQSAAILAKEKALSLLSARSYTERGLYDKLYTFTDNEESAWTAVLRMRELGLVDDLDYARRYGADCMNLKGYSLSRTKQALRQKGIHPDVIDEALSEHEDCDPEPMIAHVILRRYLKHISTEEGQKKTISALSRKGFRYTDIRTVIENLLDDEEYYSDCIE
jgi:regulatory protein